MLKVLRMNLHLAKRYSLCNVAKNRVQKAISKSSLKTLKSRTKWIANMLMRSSIIGVVDRVLIRTRGAFATLLVTPIFDCWRNI